LHHAAEAANFDAVVFYQAITAATRKSPFLALDLLTL
jgi:hypothetical protein